MPKLQTSPWQVVIDGEVAKPVTLDVDELRKRFTLEERIYRFRCVEAWSMVIPGLALSLVHYSNGCSLRRGLAMWPSRAYTIQNRCRAKPMVNSAVVFNFPMSKGCGWMKPCIH